MIRINQIKLDVGQGEKKLEKEIKQKLGINNQEFSYRIVKKSLDCRVKHPLKEVYCVNVSLADDSFEKKICQKVKSNNIMLTKKKKYQAVWDEKNEFDDRVVVIGTGPAGLFCGYVLALNGYRPILLERGQCMEQRSQDVNAFWEGKQPLNPESNVQFGEGGAGTFSDGKLNTVVKDKYGRQSFVLDTFVSCGAPEDIAYLAKPHIGTDYLKTVIVNLRQKMQALGAEFHFSSKVVDLVLDESGESKEVSGVVLENGEVISSKHVVFAIGHSARDTFEMLQKNHTDMEAKPFAVGVRMEHPREMIDALQYKEHYQGNTLPTANYKLTHQAENGRSVFTFCMCPGGYVVNASSEEGHTVVNGMSNYDRMATNSNSAIIASVTPEDYPGTDVLSGVAFQRQLEHAAFEQGKGKIPVQLFGDFRENRPSTQMGDVFSCEKGDICLANVRSCLPESVSSAIIEAILSWDKKMPGFARPDALMLGVESRTSSPVRILRDEGFESNIKGVFPCGEGAGYAGGIMSAAMDGCKVAEAIMQLKGEKYE